MVLSLMSQTHTRLTALCPDYPGETHTRLTALCPDYPGEPVQEGKTNLDFTEARDSEWQSKCNQNIFD